MNILENILILLSILVITFVMTFAMKRYLLSRNLLVIPGLRSSHKDPKPQGGGLTIILSLFFSLSLLNYFDLVDENRFIYLIFPGLLVASIGLLDDFIGVRPVTRILIHLISACLGIYLIGGFPVISFFEYNLDLGLIGIILGLIYVVWMINLYNFMDGIDGLASLEAICILSTFSIISYFVLFDPDLSFLLLILCASIFGFLILNFPKSQIFIGDVGSGFLGIVISLISIYSSQNHPELFWSWLILLGIFLVDSTYTLIRRVFLKEKFYLAHSTHAYQKLVRITNSHWKTSVLVVVINLLWLAPIAFLVALDKIEGIYGIMLAYAPLLLLVYFLNAGLPDKQDL